VRPAWRPVRDPVALIAESSPAGTPCRLIWVCGAASRLPGSGETVTAPPRIAELLSVAGGHEGLACAAADGSAPIAQAAHRMRVRMENIDPEHNRKVDRRTFLKGGLIAGAGLAIGLADGCGASGSGPAAKAARSTTRITPSPPSAKPNILVIIVDQLRYPQWFSPAASALGLPANLQQLQRGAVTFARHYTASNDCSPARATLLTGLHTHQTGCMITGGSTLDPGFPTWGTMLREHGYDTRWWGKWHLTHGDHHWNAVRGERALERYGFAGGTFPSPDGAPGQGWRVDPQITRQFTDWLASEGRGGPWCATVSLINPHDIAWWYAWTKRVPAERLMGSTVRNLPPNFETPELLIARGKPRLQRSLQGTAATSFGPVPFHGPGAHGRWLEFQNLYVKLQNEVDRNIGNLLAALESQPQVAANTVVIFTSDHGEYGGSHGLRGKGASAYEEGIRVPLIVKDPRGKLTAAPERVRTQLTSSVDVLPLLLTIGTGSNAWRAEPHYSHIAHRPDLAAILADPSAPGRSHVLHATDEIVTEFAIERYAADAPRHVIALRTASAKYATYSRWSPEGITPLTSGQEDELYDYRTHAGRLELENTAGNSPREAGLRTQLADAISSELRAPLPPRMHAAHARGFADYSSTAKRAAVASAAMRKRRSERTVGHLDPGDTAGERAHK
jgi:arylsulfatase A-like enzyme